jgi:hypothetical protein
MKRYKLVPHCETFKPDNNATHFNIYCLVDITERKLVADWFVSTPVKLWTNWPELEYESEPSFITAYIELSPTLKEFDTKEEFIQWFYEFYFEHLI